MSHVTCHSTAEKRRDMLGLQTPLEVRTNTPVASTSCCAISFRHSGNSEITRGRRYRASWAYLLLPVADTKMLSPWHCTGMSSEKLVHMDIMRLSHSEHSQNKGDLLTISPRSSLLKSRGLIAMCM